MALDPTTTADILDWIGVEEDGEDMQAMFDLRGTVEGASLSLLKRRRALLGPDSWSLAGDYSENDNGRRAAWLDRQIGDLSQLLDDPDDSVLTTGTLTRMQPGR